MKVRFVVFIFLFLSFNSRAQYFEPIGNGIGIDGVQSNATRVKSILNDTIHHKLLIGGEFLYADSIPVIGGCAWDGSSYIPMVLSTSNIRMSSTMWNGFNVFAVDLNVQLFDSTQGVVFNYPPLFSGVADIHDVISYNGNLYIGGGFFLQDGTLGLARWNGTDWEGVGGSITGTTIEYIQCLGIYNGDLIAAGTFDSIGGIAANHIARWDGVQWHPMGGGVNVTSNPPQVRDILEFQGGVYVTGIIDWAGGLSCDGFAMWDGNNWSIPTIEMVHGNELEVYHNKLYIAGPVYIAPNGGGFASYDGISFKVYHAGSIYAMDTFQNYLYLGGGFDELGDSVFANRIARFSDDSVVCIPPVIVTSGDTLFVNETGYFHWINCNDGSIITGATSNIFIPDTAGNYAVIVTGSGCNDTSACVSFTGTVELQIEAYGLQIYPNPANETVTITAENIREIVVSNLLGELVQSSKYKVQSNTATIDISKLPQGIYMLRVQTNDGWRVGKVVKE